METLTPDLAESLAAAYLARSGIHFEPAVGTHFDICSVYTESPEYGCSCGIPALFAGLIELLLPGFADAAARLGLEGKPFWAQEYPGLLMECAEASSARAA